jgi:hypothetical protein
MSQMLIEIESETDDISIGDGQRWSDTALKEKMQIKCYMWKKSKTKLLEFVRILLNKFDFLF